MKSIIKAVVLSLATTFALGSCTKYNLIETGLSNGVHETSMNGYFSTDPYNWEETQKLIKKAGLESYFTSTATGSKGITFLGVTDLSIIRYVAEQQVKENEAAETEGREAKTIELDDITQEDARNMLVNCIIPQRIMLKDVPRGRLTTTDGNTTRTGGMTVTTLGGEKLWLYTFQEDFNNVPNSGPVSLYVVSEKTQKRVKIASSDIQTQTGIVHSLPYSFTLGEF